VIAELRVRDLATIADVTLQLAPGPSEHTMGASSSNSAIQEGGQVVVPTLLGTVRFQPSSIEVFPADSKISVPSQLVPAEGSNVQR